MNKTTEALKLAKKVISKYSLYCECMGNDDAKEALAAIREARAEQKKQEPVGEVDLHKELGQLRWMGGDEGWDNAIHAVRKRLEELYAAPVSAKREWVELTVSDLDAIIEKHYDDEMDLKAMILDGIAAFKEKNT